jgi:hypothetical protein
MTRAAQFTIRQYLVAVPIIAYFCAFPELAMLLGIFVTSLLFVAPVVLAVYLSCRFLLRDRRPSNLHPRDTTAHVSLRSLAARIRCCLRSDEPDAGAQRLDRYVPGLVRASRVQITR